MSRPEKYPKDRILDAAATLIAEGGPAALSISGVARRLGAPSGSIYHRFRSRDVLAGCLWLRSVERFQDGFLRALEEEDARVAIRRAAAHVLTWSRHNLDEARLLLMYRSSDLIDGDWPPELEEENRHLRARLNGAIADVCRRLGAVESDDRRRVQFALIDIPYGAVRGPLNRGMQPEPGLDAIIDDAVAAVIDGIHARRTT